MKWKILVLVAGIASKFVIVSASAQGTAFTYQGRLTDNGNPANGNYDLQFYLRDALVAGNPVGVTNTIAPVAANNGLFTVTLDFGPDIFTGPGRWLEIGARTNGSMAAYTTLAPRQPLTPTPYAITASNLTGTLPAAQLTGTLPASSLAGTYSGAVTFNNAANSFAGNGAGLTNLNASELHGALPAISGENLTRVNQASVFTLNYPINTNLAYVSGAGMVPGCLVAGPFDGSPANGVFYRVGTGLLNNRPWWTNASGVVWYGGRDGGDFGGNYILALNLNTNADTDPYTGFLYSNDALWSDYEGTANFQDTFWYDCAGNCFTNIGHFATNTAVAPVFYSAPPWVTAGQLLSASNSIQNGSAGAALLAASNAIVNGNGARLTNMPPPAGFNDYAMPTPIMEWNTYCQDITPAWFNETAILHVATNLINYGYYAAGWNTIALDDSWEARTRDGNGDLQANPTNFPSGFPALTAALHSLGFRVSIYTSYPFSTCYGFPGTSKDTVQRDINKFASWGFDIFFVDSCGQPNPVSLSGIPGQYEEIQLFANAVWHVEPHRTLISYIGLSRRHTFLGPNEYTPALNGMEQWINAGTDGSYDFLDVGISNIVSSASTITNQPQFLKPGHTKNMGGFYLGSSGQAVKDIMTSLAMDSALMIMCWTNETGIAKQYMTNREVIAIDQDPGFHCPVVAAQTGTYQIWTKQLGLTSSASSAVALWNWGPTATNLTVPWAWLGISSNTPVKVRDLWAQADLGIFTGFYSNTVPSSNELMLAFVQQPVAWPGSGQGIVTNNGLVWVSTNLATGIAPATAAPDGSILTSTSGAFYVRSNGVWVLH